MADPCQQVTSGTTDIGPVFCRNPRAFDVGMGAAGLFMVALMASGNLKIGGRHGWAGQVIMAGLCRISIPIWARALDHNGVGHLSCASVSIR